MVILARTIIRFEIEPLPSDIREDPRFYPFFKNCIGAVDGSHYPCLPPGEDIEAYRNRKGAVTMNVMMVVNLRGRFSYIVSGWEGSAHDWKVFMSAVNNLKLAIPKGKYLLGDAGYTASHRVLTPYRGEFAPTFFPIKLSVSLACTILTLYYTTGIRYHLQESAHAGLRPETPEELYNLRHSQRRIIVEMAIGWHKATFKILTNRPSYPVRVQNGIIFATAGLTNWIKEYGRIDRLPDVAMEGDGYWAPDLGPLATGSINRGRGMELSPAECDGTTNGAMSGFRHQMAINMWQQYKAYRKRKFVDVNDINVGRADSDLSSDDEGGDDEGGDDKGNDE